MSDGGDNGRMPRVEEAVIDDATLGALVDDLAACATIEEVRIKGGAMERAQGDGTEIRTALDALRSGRARAAQFVYTHKGQRWIDTVLRSEAGWRVVRCESLS